MIFKANEVAPGHKNIRCLELPDFTVYWQGLAYWDGELAGKASIERFAREYEHDGVAATAGLRGLYFVAIARKGSHEFCAFVDNSGLFHAFYSPRFIATSFLELATAENLSASDFDPAAVAEFFHFGGVSFGATVFPQIRKIGADEMVRITDEGVKVGRKPLADLDSTPRSTLLEVLESLAVSAQEENVSVDLTGGTDTRLLAVVLRHFGLSYELALSGVEGIREVQLARQVAKALGQPLHLWHHDVSDLESCLFDLFLACDGSCDPLKYHRTWQLQQDRARRGVTLMLNGVGGGLYKDWLWLQDFPFYGRRTPNLERLYNLRIAPVGLKHDYLRGEYREASTRYRERLLHKLSQFVVPGATQTYDRILYHYKTREYAGRFLTNHQAMLRSYAPFLEHDAVIWACHMPRAERFLSNFHRKTITRFNPAVARIPTTEGGVTVSAKRQDLAADTVKYVGNYATRAANKVGQRIFGKAYFEESPNHPELYATARRLQAFHEALVAMKDHGILEKNVEAATVATPYVGAILNLGSLLQWLERQQAPKKKMESTAVRRQAAGR